MALLLRLQLLQLKSPWLAIRGRFKHPVMVGLQISGWCKNAKWDCDIMFDKGERDHLRCSGGVCPAGGTSGGQLQGGVERV